MGLPLLGVMSTGAPLTRYMEFPPRTRYIDHAPLSWQVFCGYALFIFIAVVPLVVQAVRTIRKADAASAHHGQFPWWGWAGASTGLLFWVLAWTRFSWFSNFQPHTFTPLWLSFIMVVNALTFRRSGRCLMLERPLYFLLLFPASALFWWFFEYLNRFVQNWYYVGVHYNAVEYFWYASICFSTVLPSVMSVRELLNTCSWLKTGYGRYVPVDFFESRKIAYFLLVLSGFGLTLIGIWPDYLFALLWVSPLFIIISVQILMGIPHVLSGLKKGDWRLVMSSAIAALICGWFWEMWNYLSLARWEYSIPYVHRLLIFEMPLLGYAGYLPFGLECSAVAEILADFQTDVS